MLGFSKKNILISVLCLTLCIISTSSVLAFNKGASGPDVYVMQGALKSLGFYAGKIDGNYGDLLVKGVKEFQSKKGLPVTGSVDSKTLESILWAYSQQKTNGSSTGSPSSEAKPKATGPNLPLVSPKPTVVPTPWSKLTLTADESRMVELVNQERQKNGLSALSIDLRLTEIARLKSKDMIDLNYFAHQSPTYGSPFQMLKQFEVQYYSAGENLACNQTVQKAHLALMNSQGHRENILNKSFTHIGIGIVQGGPCGTMYTQLFVGKSTP